MSIPELIGASLTSLLFIWLINKYIFKKWLKLSKSLLKTWFTWLIISTFIGTLGRGNDGFNIMNRIMASDVDAIAVLINSFLISLIASSIAAGILIYANYDK